MDDAAIGRSTTHASSSAQVGVDSHLGDFLASVRAGNTKVILDAVGKTQLKTAGTKVDSGGPANSSSYCIFRCRIGADGLITAWLPRSWPARKKFFGRALNLRAHSAG